MIKKVSRRGFLKGLAAGGLLLGVDLVPRAVQAAVSAPGRPAYDPLVWLAIAPNGQTHVVVARSEMGQGARSTLALVVADELRASPAKIVITQAPGDENRYGSQNTDGSTSIRQGLEHVRQTGAAARMMLMAAAAALWKVPVAELEARDHAVHHAASGRSAGYGELAPAAWRQPVPTDIVLAPHDEMHLIGKEGLKSLDLDDMVRGRAKYGIDVLLPGLKYAMIERPPVYGGTVAHYDAKATLATPGVEKVFQLPDGHLPGGFSPLGGVAVIASNTWAAWQGRKQLQIKWHDGPNGSYDSKHYRQALEKTVTHPCRPVLAHGDTMKALAHAHKHVQATYYVPHLAHAPMETPVATASFANGRCEVWAPTQHPQAARDEVAKALGIPASDVTVHVTLLGGGFGRKSKPDFIVEAALLSKFANAPVKVQWTREDEIQHGYYHAVSAQHLEAALTSQGKIDAWLHRTAFPAIPSTFAPGVHHASDAELGMGVTDLPYAIPNVKIENGDADPHVRTGWFRAVANIQHAFAVNSFMCELAHAAKTDHRAFLLEMLGGDRHFEPANWNYSEDAGSAPVDTARLRHVIELVTEKARWGRQLPHGHGLGLAVHRSFTSYVATVVEVVVDAHGKLSIPRVDTAIDCGFAANPDRVRSQMEGAATMALSTALYGEISFQHGRAQQNNFNDYQVARMDVAPKVVYTHLANSGKKTGGVGEPGIPPFAPALANAIFMATGKRIRALPIADQLAKA